MEGQEEFNTTWITADSSEPVETKNEKQLDDCKPYLDNKFCNDIDEDKWKLPDSSVMNSSQEIISEGSELIKIKEEALDHDYSLSSVPDCQFVEDLNQNSSPDTMNSDNKFEQSPQEFLQEPQQEFSSFETQIMSYPPSAENSSRFTRKSSDLTTCKQCGKNFSCNRSYRRHMLVHSGDRPYSCKDCGSAFSRKDSLLAHERRHRRRTTHFRYHCQYCGINFLNTLQLHNHMQMHVPPQNSNQSEEEKGIIITTNSQGISTVAKPPILSPILPATSPVEPSNYECELQSNINTPPFGNPSDKKFYKCPFCRKLFAKQYALHYHMKTHTQMFHCEFCGKMFRFRRNKQVHIIKCHSTFQCTHCQRNFPNDETLRNHQILYCNKIMNNLISPPHHNPTNLSAITTHSMHSEGGTYFQNNLDPQRHNAASSSSSGCFYELTDGNANGINATITDTPPPVQTQPNEVCAVKDTKSTSSNSEVINSILKCNICNSRLQKPRTLPCTHSFCHTCLESRLDKNTSSLMCPTCQLVLVLPEAGLANIQANQMISSMLSEVENSEQSTYPVCIVCEDSASHHCQQCDAFICIRCSKAHLKLPATKDHTQISLTEYNSKDPRERMSNTVVMCKEHDSPSQFFCSSCQKLICVGCTLVDHPKGSEHEIIDLSTAFSSFCSDIQPLMAKCEEREKKVSSVIDEMKPILQMGHQIKFSCKKSIRSYITKLKEVVDQMQEKLLSEVEELTNAKQMAIDSKMESLKKELLDVSGTRLLAKQLIASPSNSLALTMTSNVSRHIKALLHKSSPTSYLDMKKAVTFIPCEELLELIQQKGIGSLEETDDVRTEPGEVIMIE